MKKDIISALQCVTRELYKEGERERKSRQRSYYSPRVYEYSNRVTLKEAVFDVIPQAVDKATGGGQYAVSARTLYYQVRPLIQDEVKKPLKYDYFSQTLLVQYQEENGPINELYYDPRGVLYEPHTGKATPLGTREIDTYEFPSWLYNKILYIEKKGLWPILKSSKIAERYDMAIIAGEGYATEATRILFENAERDQEYELYVLHDADPYGYNIARTLQEETDRMPGYSVNVVDLGLFLEEALAMSLQTESFLRKNALPWGLNLSATEKEHFEGEQRGYRGWVCKRIELNAFTAPALIKYIEDKLKEVGASGKVIPPDEEISKEIEDMYWTEIGNQVKGVLNRFFSIEAIIDDIGKDFKERISLENASQWIEEEFKENNSQSWKQALEDSFDSKMEEQESDIKKAIRKRIRDAIKKQNIIERQS